MICYWISCWTETEILNSDFVADLSYADPLVILSGLVGSEEILSGRVGSEEILNGHATWIGCLSVAACFCDRNHLAKPTDQNCPLPYLGADSWPRTYL